ncbi:hypothetical protein [Thioalbus denitrificans]|uniref:DUF1611 domain-containing protein n=1 Tax=Thioalbus denitrificans TaxID=547122 RepID=A0A369C9M1_9GAMM|nr:hypothetical protein [Thioalbus denitrificans]RCX30730.1 hypothetical protein DFQ59_104166 [Thioalbus denitrificans]
MSKPTEQARMAARPAPLELAGAETQPLAPARLARAKSAYTTRRVPLAETAALLLSGDVRPRAGDLVLAEVVRPRQHTRLELGTGRRAQLYPGDEIVVCYGDRYAPDQFEAHVPKDLGPCHLVAAGGVAALVRSRHGRMKPATEIRPLGLLADAGGRRLNLADWSLAAPGSGGGQPRPFTVAVLGTAMNAGKTTTAGHLVRGLVRAGLRVGAAKVTGTGAGGDAWFLTDTGAHHVYDFTDAGAASTYRLPPERVDAILDTLTGRLAADGAEVVVLEVADGLFQPETAALLASPRFAAAVDGIVFAAGDAMGAMGGVLHLEHYDLPVLAVSGALTASPLARREAETATGLPVLDLEALAAADVLDRLQAQLPGREPELAVAL